MIATFVRNTCSPDCYRLEHSRCGRSRICLQWQLYHITISAKGIEAQIVRREKTSMRKTFLALLLAASVTPAFAQEKTVNLKVSLWVPPAHPLVPATQAWAADIEKASGGSIKVAVFPSEQLGKAFDHYDMARDGIADITYVNPGYQPGRFPIAAAGQLPFVFSDGKKGTLALNEWYHKYAPKEMKDTKLCFAFIHDPGALHGKKKIVVPSDLSA